MTEAEETVEWPALERRIARPLDGLAGLADRDPRRPAVVGRGSCAVPVDRRPALAEWRCRRAGAPPDRLPAGRGQGARAAPERPGGPALRHQPPRLRPVQRSIAEPCVDPGRHRPDEAVRIQRPAHVALPQRSGRRRAVRRARPLRDQRGRHRVARLLGVAVRGPALPRGMGLTRLADGDPRQEPPLDHPLVPGQRVGLRRQPRCRGRLAAALRPEPAAPLRGRDPVRVVVETDGQRHHGPDVPADRRDRRPRHERLPASSPDHVRVLARDGQQQRDPGRVLGCDRGHARAAGRLHLGVVGSRPRPGAARRHPALGLRRRLRRRAERRQLLPRRSRLSGSPPEAGALGAQASRRAGADLGVAREPRGRAGHDHEPAVRSRPGLAGRNLGAGHRGRHARLGRRGDPRRPSRHERDGRSPGLAREQPLGNPRGLADAAVRDPGRAALGAGRLRGLRCPAQHRRDG